MLKNLNVPRGTKRSIKASTLWCKKRMLGSPQGQRPVSIRVHSTTKLTVVPVLKVGRIVGFAK